MEKGIKALGDLVKFTKYSKWIEEEKRRETWEEMCFRNMNMHLKKFKYVKRLLNRYRDTDVLSERLILNHLIVIFNVFGIQPGLDILELKIELEHWGVLKPFLIFLKSIKNHEYTNIQMDTKVVEALRQISQS